MEYAVLEFFCQNQSGLMLVPSFIYKNGEQVKSFLPFELEIDLCSMFIPALLASESCTPVRFLITNNGLMFGSVDDESSGYTIVLGPLKAMDIDESGLRQMLADSELPFTEATLRKLRQSCGRVSAMPFEQFLMSLSALNASINHSIVTPERFGVPKSTRQELPTLEDSSWRSVPGQSSAAIDDIKRELSYKYEQQMCYCVRNGMLEQIQKQATDGFFGMTGTVGLDALRQMKNLLLAMVVLCSRAAMEGGLSPLTSYSQSDVFYIQIELAGDMDTLKHIAYKIPMDYCRRVRETGYPCAAGLVTRKTIRYIQNRLSERIVAEEIACELGVSAGYLSRTFSSAMGKSIPQYVKEQRVVAAKYLLLYDDKPLAQIAALLGFSSQSHFQNCFKAVTGMTPKEFKNTGYA